MCFICSVWIWIRQGQGLQSMKNVLGTSDETNHGPVQQYSFFRIGYTEQRPNVAVLTSNGDVLAQVKTYWYEFIGR